MNNQIPFPGHLPITTFILSLCSSIFCNADDWPQWLGPQGDSTWRETGIIDEISADGLRYKWRHNVGLGYSGPAVAGGRVYVMDYQKTSGEISNRASWKDELEGNERILCLSSETGELLWKYEYPPAGITSLFPVAPDVPHPLLKGKSTPSGRREIWST